MSVELLLQIAMATLSALGTFMLGMGERDATLPLVAMVVSASSVYLTDVSGWLRLNARVANVAGSMAVVVFAWDFLQRFGSETLLLAVANLLIYLQFILLYQKKTASTYWLLALLSLLQVAVAAALNFELVFGVLLLVYVFFGFVTLGLFYIYRQRELAEQALARATDQYDTLLATASIEVDAPHAPLVATRWEQAPSEWLVPWAFLRQMGAMATLAVAFSLAFFFLMPRFNHRPWQRFETVVQPVVGIAEEVSLGQLGEIVESPEEVMRINFYQGDSQVPYKLTEVPFLRGYYLTSYLQGNWRKAASSPDPLTTGPLQWGLVRQEIEIEPLQVSSLFCVYPLVEGSTRQEHLYYDFAREQLVRSKDMCENRMRYTVYTTAFENGRQKRFVPAGRALHFPMQPDDHPDTREFYAKPDKSLAPLVTFAQEMVSDLHEAGSLAKARRLNSYLHDSGKFRYSLRSPKRDPRQDAIVDFLFDRPEGHCEYFATALTLMLRSAGIPARMVIGFNGADWNPFGYYQVRQLHAHAWVEAYFPFEELPEELQAEGRRWANGAWLTLDPTPGVGSSASRLGSRLGLPTLRQAVDYLRFLWSSYIMGMDADRQIYIIYIPLLQGVARFVTRLFEHPWWLAIWDRSPAQRIALGLALVGLVVVGWWLLRYGGRAPWQRLRLWLARRRLMPERARPDRVVVVEFYRRFESLMAAAHFERPAALTQREFALTVADRLGAHPETAQAAPLPLAITEAFYRVRFGSRVLDKQEVDLVEKALSELRAAVARLIDPARPAQ